MNFEIIGGITQVETIAVGNEIREIYRLQEQYGERRWHKLKGTTLIRLKSGKIRKAEIHWYEAHGLGKKEFKLKCYLD